MVSPRAAAATSAPDPMVQASPEPKCPCQRDQAALAVAQQGVTLPQVADVVAELHARLAHDEIFVTGVHDAVDHEAVILAEALTRLTLIEQKLVESAGLVVQLAADAKANDEHLGSKLWTELNAVTSLLGDKFRAENVKTQ